jgi:hypothetical protein
MRLVRYIVLFSGFASLLWILLLHFRKESRMLEVEVRDPRLREKCLHWERAVRARGLDPGAGLGRLRSIGSSPDRRCAGRYLTWTSDILISDQLFSRGDWSVRCALYHELGHAVFRLEHAESGIMSAEIPSEEHLEQNWNKLLTDYLNQCYDKRWESL